MVDNGLMDTARHERQEVLLTTPRGRVRVPVWIRRFSPRTASATQIGQLESLPEVTVVQIDSLEDILTKEKFVESLADVVERTESRSRILFVLSKRVKIREEGGLSTLFKRFPRPSDLEVAHEGEPATLAIFEAFAKNWALREGQREPHEDPFLRVKSFVKATRDLRAASGRLSARRVAETFGLSLSEVARIAGVTRQAVSKTDDSPSIQDALKPFERIARLRARLPQRDFQRWLNMPSESLEGGAPIDVIRDGKVEAIADWVENLLVGHPI